MEKDNPEYRKLIIKQTKDELHKIGDFWRNDKSSLNTTPIMNILSLKLQLSKVIEEIKRITNS